MSGVLCPHSSLLGSARVSYIDLVDPSVGNNAVGCPINTVWGNKLLPVKIAFLGVLVLASILVSAMSSPQKEIHLTDRNERDYRYAFYYY